MDKKLVLIFLVLAASTHFSCTKKTGDTAVEQKVVNLAVWSNYTPPKLLADFTTKTGIRVEVANYSSNEELLAKLQAGASGYDVAVPSDYMVFAMIKLGLVTALDYSKIPNAKDVDAQFLKKNYDPTNQYSIPYDWGTTGIAVNRLLYKGTIKGWKNVFENPDLAGKFTLLDDVRETIGAALKSQGFSLNSKNPDELAKAKQLLFKIRPKVKGFTSEPLMPLVNGETAVAHAFSVDALQARRTSGGKIDYVIPEEGGTLSIDNLVIPKGAPHPQEALVFIKFLLEATSMVETVNAVFVAPTNLKVIPLLATDVQQNEGLFPKAARLKNFEMIQDLGPELTAWDRVWTEVKSLNQ